LICFFMVLSFFFMNFGQQSGGQFQHKMSNLSLIITTWATSGFIQATEAAWHQIQLNGDTLEAVLVGCSVCQELQCDGTVGYGGSPNEFGETTLDALVIHGFDHSFAMRYTLTAFQFIIRPTGDVGAVASLKRIKEAIRVAAAVMKYTKHTLLVGEAATSFALEMGFSESDLHTPESTQMWKTWVEGNCQPNYRKNVVPDPSKSCGPYTPLLQTDNTDDWSHAQIDSHDTIGMIAIHGEEISAGTSTNGMRYKIPGRVGDSPIPGSGAFVDNDVGAACATGDGDILMRMLPSYQTVENMRTSMTPTEAAMDAISRVAKKYPTFKGAIIAANRYGHVGAACHGFDTFTYSLRDASHTGVVKTAILCSKMKKWNYYYCSLNFQINATSAESWQFYNNQAVPSENWLAMSLLWLFENLRVEPFGIIPLASLTGKGGPTTLKHHHIVASYNWQDEPSSTIYVPGAPKRYVTWPGGRLQEDNGQLIYDINHVRLPDGPMDPLFDALEICSESRFDPGAFDLVTDCINLQKLFTFCKGEESSGFFRIDLERVGDAVLACRVEAQDVIQIDFPSHDQSLKAACTQPVHPTLAGSHQRIVAYSFGDLRMLVRYEVDCVDYTVEELERQLLEQEEAQSTAIQEPSPVDDPQQRLKHIRSKSTNTSSNCSPSVNVTTYPDGRGFPAFTWPLLFFAGSSAVVVGWMTEQNNFKKPVMYKPTDVNRLLKPLPYAALSKVYDLLSKIVAFMRRNDENMKASLIWRGEQFVEIYEKAPTASGAVSQAWRRRLTGGN
ncbi:putative N(4)-(Beta-N-acetylglucosaminyl)-L-asparaginase, partial [Trichinella nelsoni]